MLFKREIAEAAAKILGQSAADIEKDIEMPESKIGDFALPCFKYAKILRTSPQNIAKSITQSQLPAFVTKAEAVNGYANFFVDRELFSKRTLDEIQSKGELYGSANLGRGRTVCIDYSSINIAKPCHIGHLSSTVMGHALYNIYNFLGYKSVGINHLGDWGTQFGKLIAAYRHWGSDQELKKGGVDYLVTLYVKFHEQSETDESLTLEAREWFKKIEQGDEYAMTLFTLFREVTLDEVMHIYDLLGVKFDSYAGESFYNDKLQAVVDELEGKGLLTLSEGAKVMDLSEYGMPPCIIMKSDGASLYATRDIAAALYRK